MSLEQSDAEAAAVATHPRVSLKDIEGAIACRYDFTADQAVRGMDGSTPTHEALRLLSICILVMRNGFTVIGKSAPASPENFNIALGRKFSYEDAIRQLWPLMGFALRDRLHNTPYGCGAKVVFNPGFIETPEGQVVREERMKDGELGIGGGYQTPLQAKAPHPMPNDADKLGIGADEAKQFDQQAPHISAAQRERAAKFEAKMAAHDKQAAEEREGQRPFVDQSGKEYYPGFRPDLDMADWVYDAIFDEMVRRPKGT